MTVSTGIITTIAGTGTGSYSGDDGPATMATLYYPYGVALDASGTLTIIIICYIVCTRFDCFLDFNIIIGNVYIGDCWNHRIRKVTASTGIINTIAGTGNTVYGGENGPATSATLYYPVGVALDASGTGTILLMKIFGALCVFFNYYSPL